MRTGANTSERDVRHVSIPDLPTADHGLLHLPGVRLPVVLPEHGNGNQRRPRVVRPDLLLGLSHRHQRHRVSITVPPCKVISLSNLFWFLVRSWPSCRVYLYLSAPIVLGYAYLQRCCVVGLVSP